MTVADRLARVQRALTLIAFSAAHTADEGTYIRTFSGADLAEAIAATAGEAFDELYWITKVPGRLLATPAPTDDQRAEDEETAEQLEAIRADGHFKDLLARVEQPQTGRP